MKQSRMGRAVFEGVELEYEVRGNGEWVVLIHAGVFADWFNPLLARRHGARFGRLLRA
jgi:hypothetical protein